MMDTISNLLSDLFKEGQKIGKFKYFMYCVSLTLFLPFTLIVLALYIMYRLHIGRLYDATNDINWSIRWGENIAQFMLFAMFLYWIFYNVPSLQYSHIGMAIFCLIIPLTALALFLILLFI